MPRYLDSSDRWQGETDRKIRELHTMVASVPTDATAAPWTAVTSFGAGWSDLAATDSSFKTIGIQRLPGGRAAFRGGATRTGSGWPGAGFTLLTLPTGLWPDATHDFICASSGGGGYVFVELRTSGSVLVWGWGGGGTGTAGTGVCLDPVVYRLA